MLINQSQGARNHSKEPSPKPLGNLKLRLLTRRDRKKRRDIKSKLTEASHTHRLDLRCLDLSTLPPLPPNITTLLLSYNNLDSLPKLPDSLRILDVAHNNFSEIPKSLLNLPNLLIADFSGNHLSPLPSRSRSSAIILVNPDYSIEQIDKDWFDGNRPQSEIEESRENFTNIDDGKYQTDDEDSFDEDLQEDVTNSESCDSKNSEDTSNSSDFEVSSECAQLFLDFLAGSKIEDKDIEMLESRLALDRDLKYFVQVCFDVKKILPRYPWENRWGYGNSMWGEKNDNVGIGKKQIDDPPKQGTVFLDEVSYSKNWRGR
ncbi:hypothetical protein HK096_008178, partial [Nowakowskiella sp. JEL0078]